ncbi:transmembrane protein 68-like [Anopheles nili]|uniref:transmembrane protein 68-like n=1 Tax=Anopheles nili TaxID=185578 RepID=UPI00237AB1FA|nr:transmembrane protein 68-like [Anopheles nili]
MDIESSSMPALGSTMIDWFGLVHNLSLPLVILFLLPWMYVLLILSSVPYLHLCNFFRLRFWKHIHEDEFWNHARRMMAFVWHLHSKVFHGYEVIGLENLPENGPALLIYYHGALPIDMYYLTAATMIKRNRLIHTVGDRFLDQIPGWKLVSRVMKVTSGSAQSCVATLHSGELLSIAPGGVYEAQFGDKSYEVLWKNRTGFARVALEAQVPIIPMFTVNIRECFRTVSIAKWIFKRIYEALKIPVLPIYGGFPVKLRTVLGKPIPYDGSLTPAALQQKIASAIANLISEHQRVPGDILQAIGDRFDTDNISKKAARC